jgi:hypothetical protein
VAVKVEQRQVYVAFDGAEFPTEAQCLAHERKHGERLLIGMTAEQLAHALDGSDGQRSAALERAGYAVRKARQAAGNLRRRSPGGQNAGGNPSSALREPPASASAADSAGGTEPELQRAEP